MKKILLTLMCPVILALVPACTPNPAGNQGENLSDNEYACWKVTTNWNGVTSTAYLWATKGEMKTQYAYYSKDMVTYELASPEDENSCNKMNANATSEGTINGKTYNNDILKCWKIDFKGSDFEGTETLYSWSTEYGLVRWCEEKVAQYKADGGSASYKYSQAEADDMDACINLND